MSLTARKLSALLRGWTPGQAESGRGLVDRAADELDQLQDEVDILRAELCKAEWAGRYVGSTRGFPECCPSCNALVDAGHNPDCSLNAAINATRSTPAEPEIL